MTAKQLRRHWVKHLMREPYVRGMLKDKYITVSPQHYLYSWCLEDRKLWRGEITLRQFRKNISRIKDGWYVKSW